MEKNLSAFVLCKMNAVKSGKIDSCIIQLLRPISKKFALKLTANWQKKI